MSHRPRTHTYLALLAATAAVATAMLGIAPATGAAPDGVYAFEDFRRTSTSGWGTSGKGGTWTHSSGSARDFTLDGSGTASITSRGGGWRLASMLHGATATNTEVRTKVALDRRPLTGHADVDVVTRWAPSDTSYAVRTKISADGRVRVFLVRTRGTSSSTLAAVSVPGLVYTNDTVLKVRAQTAGRGATTHRAKIWVEGTPEPSAWTVVHTDRNGGRTAGAVGVRMYAAGAVTMLPTTVKFTGFAAGVPGETPDASDPIPPQPPAPPELPEIGTYVPDASTTGVPAGTQLTVHHGDIKVTKDNTVIDGLDVRGVISVEAKNVLIKNTIVRGKPTTKQTALVRSHSDDASVTIQDSELYNAYPSSWIDGVRGWNLTLRRVHIHDVIDMVHIYGDNVNIEGSYMHDNIHYDEDPAWDGNPSHDDSIQIQIGKNIRIYGNNISGAYNTGIQFTQDRGPVSDVTIQNNLLDGGGCTINLAEKGKGPFQRITITDNTFGRSTRVPNCAIISPPTTVPTVANNYYVDGVAVTVRKGS